MSLLFWKALQRVPTRTVETESRHKVKILTKFRKHGQNKLFCGRLVTMPYSAKLGVWNA